MKNVKTVLLTLFSIFVISCRSSDLEKGMVCLRLGDYNGAVKFYGRVLERKPANFEARLGMGKALLQRFAAQPLDTLSWSSAVMNLEAAGTLNSSEEIQQLLSQIWAERAHFLLRHTDTLLALEALTRAIEYDPFSAEPLNIAGIIYFRMGRIGKARALLAKAAQIDSTNSSALFNLGMIGWFENDIKTAHKEWYRALRSSPDDEDILYWFARAEKRLREQQ